MLPSHCIHLPLSPPLAQSIKPYMAGDDDFAWDYGLALAAVGRSKEAAEQLQSVRNEEYR
jgi:hypothetical protein